MRTWAIAGLSVLAACGGTMNGASTTGSGGGNGTGGATSGATGGTSAGPGTTGGSSGSSSGGVTWTLLDGGSTSLSLSQGVVPASVTIPSAIVDPFGVGNTFPVVLQFAAPSASGSLTLSDGAVDDYAGAPAVSPNTLPTDDAAYEGPEVGGHDFALVYVSFVNEGSTPISFPGSPTITLPGTGNLGESDVSCQLDLFYPPSTWRPVPGALDVFELGSSTPCTIPPGVLSDGGALDFILPPGQTIAAIGCD